MTSDVRSYVLRRDGGCVLAVKLRVPGHICRDQWGNLHGAFALDKMSLEHVKSDLRLGKRAESDPRHLVTMCMGGNIGVPSKEVRDALRRYLDAVETPLTRPEG